MPGHHKWEDVKKARFGLSEEDEEYLDLMDYTSTVPKFTVEQIDTENYWKFDVEEFGWHWLKKRKFFKERQKYGYAKQDWWSFDTFLAGVIAHGLERFASKEAMGYPGGSSMEQWHTELRNIADPLKKWASSERWKLDFREEQRLYTQVQEAIRNLAEIFGHLWD